MFDSSIQADKIKPQNSDVLNNEVKLTLDHTNYFFDAGIQVYEDLRKKVVIDISIFYHIIILTKPYLIIILVEQ